eukprot:TRINITY_DN15889_c0_g1_i1.p1 TRINITY_DN15889_c0_g1~~TRINITY_DN15889_c0_g1_i1.p1  ORF type:complete len:739 (+),score=213.84 TRINITY_DN15889_c0_g1_i1:70-2217(+)
MADPELAPLLQRLDPEQGDGSPRAPGYGQSKSCRLPPTWLLGLLCVAAFTKHAVGVCGWFGLLTFLLTYFVFPVTIPLNWALIVAAVLAGMSRGGNCVRFEACAVFSVVFPVISLVWLCTQQSLWLSQLNGLSYYEVSAWVVMLPVASELWWRVMHILAAPVYACYFLGHGYPDDDWVTWTRVLGAGLLLYAGVALVWAGGGNTRVQNAAMCPLVFWGWWVCTSAVAAATFKLFLWEATVGVAQDLLAARMPPIDAVLALAFVCALTAYFVIWRSQVTEQRRGLKSYVESLTRWVQHNPFYARVRDEGFDILHSTPLMGRRESSWGFGQVPGTEVSEKGDTLRKVLKAAAEGSSRSGCFRVQTSRDRLLKDALDLLVSTPKEELMANGVYVQYDMESGEDTGGVSADWFDSLGRALTDDAAGPDALLSFQEDSTLLPRSLGDPDPPEIKRLFALGRLLGLSAWFGKVCPVPLSVVLWKSAVGQPISASDIRNADEPFFNARVKPLLKPGGLAFIVEATGDPLYFVSAPTEDGSGEVHNLCSGGDTRQVTEDNLRDYLRMLSEDRMMGSRRRETQALLQGFWDLIPQECLKASGLSGRELALLIAGASEIDADAWRVAATSKGPSRAVKDFWTVVSEMSNEERARLLQFSTGCSRLPPGGFQELKFLLSMEDLSPEQLPTAHTCMRLLRIPVYPSKEILRARLMSALEHDQGFGFM